VVIGLAIYNAHTLNIAFAPAVYKKLLGQPLALDDLREVEPEVYTSLAQLLHYPAEQVEADMCLTFQARIVCRIQLASSFPSCRIFARTGIRASGARRGKGQLTAAHLAASVLRHFVPEGADLCPCMPLR
jgi:hypothetical protein